MGWLRRFLDWLRGDVGYYQPIGNDAYDYAPYADTPYERVDWDESGPWGTVHWKDGTTTRIHDEWLP